MTCNWTPPFPYSGSSGADRYEHNRAYHPGHAHDWADSPYDWEQAGAMRVQWPDRVPRTETVQRCTICLIAPSEDRAGKCVDSTGLIC